MKFVHLMKNEKFTKSSSGFYDKYFSEENEHEILYVNTPGKESLINPQLKIKQSEFYLPDNDKKEIKKLISVLSKYDYVVMHSLFFSHYLMLLNPKLVKKIIWIEWGYDLYNWPLKSKGIKTAVQNFIGNFLRNNCAAFVAIFPPDRSVFKEKFPKAKAKVFYAPYCGPSISKEYLEYSPSCSLSEKEKSGSTVLIQIGHSASKSLNHMSALSHLAHLKDENINLLLPLSYGDMKYADEVEEYAKSIFGDKAICLRDFIPSDEYFKITSQVDIGIFEVYRQIGLANINRMVFRNAKVFLPEDSIMYKYFHSNGVPVQKISELNNISFEQLVKPIKSDDSYKFDEFIKNIQDMDKKVSLWKTVYDSFAKEA